MQTTDSDMLMHVYTRYRIPQAVMTTALSFRNKSFKDLRGFGIFSGFLPNSSSLVLCSQCLNRCGAGRVRTLGGGTDPLPTILRFVSGRRNTINSRQNPAAMDRNQKIHVQPAAYEIAPPRIGPRVGAAVDLVAR